MRMSLIVGGWMLLGLVSAHAAETGMPLHPEPQVLPEIAFKDENGTALALEAWRGKFVLLNVWATWCGPCRKEMPTLDRLQGELGGDRFDVVALSIDRAGVGVVRKFFDEIDIKHLRIFIDQTGRASRELKVFGLPATLLIAPDGRELGRLVGPAEWDTPEMIDTFKALIEKYKET